VAVKQGFHSGHLTIEDSFSAEKGGINMNAAFFYGGGDIRLENVPDPVPGPGEALVTGQSSGYLRQRSAWLSRPEACLARVGNPIHDGPRAGR
jgi:hypothetical protein